MRRTEGPAATSAPNNAKDQSGFGLRVISSEHTGSNIGGLKGDFHRVSVKLPTWQSLAPGASVTLDYVYYLPAPGPANFTLAFGGKTYGLAFENARGGTSPSPSASPSASPSGGACTATAWAAGTVYTGGQQVSHKGHNWQAKWWTQNEEPGTTGDWGVWTDLGAC
ncbi:chitinase C-terminal domain-containing protein [Microtetraspora malaysiensis]|uniref:chitinase C-terminal domain-containing protein n=1 Tax=Microtetraspora malaysiensis TaxID=161358 RepID=UPI003D8CA25C